MSTSNVRLAVRLAFALVAGVGVGVVTTERPAHACSLCGCGDPLVDASDSVPRGSRFRLALDMEYLSASAASDDDPTATETVYQATVRPVFVYSPIPELNLILQVPFARKEWTLSGADSAQTTNSGLGDIELGARWFFYQHHSFVTMSRQELGVSAGLSLPTGADDATLDGERIDDHAQLGTGAYSPYLGIVYGYHRDPWNLFVSLTGRMHSTSSFGYQYGTSLQWTVRGDYKILEKLALEAAIDGRYATEDTAMDDAQVNTGGLLLSASPGFAWNVGGEVWLRGRVQIPFLFALNGTQSVGPTFFLSAQVLIR